MSKRNWLPAVLIISAGLAASSLASARTDPKCLSEPGAETPHGEHWYYRLDHVHKRKCWYLREEGLPVREHTAEPQAEHASAARTEPAAQAREEPAPKPEPPPETKAAQAEPTAPSNSSPAAAAPVPWLGVTNLSRLPPAAPAPAAVAPAASPAANASIDAQPAQAMGRVADGVSKLPAQDATAQHARVHKPAAPARELFRVLPRKPAPRPSTADTAIWNSPVFALFMLLVAGLAVAGPVFHVVQRRRRAFEAAAFRPPKWARMVPVNAPTAPQTRAPAPPLAGPEPPFSRPAAPPVARPVPPPARAKPPLARPAAPPLVPAEHTEQLARALQQLADRLRTQPEANPSIVPKPARRADPNQLLARLKIQRGGS
jgi:hypothetical protein